MLLFKYMYKQTDALFCCTDVTIICFSTKTNFSVAKAYVLF